MGCQLCGKKLGFIAKLRYGRYCSEEHRKEYQEKQHSHAFKTLVERVRDAPPQSGIPRPTEENEKQKQVPVAAVTNQSAPEVSEEELKKIQKELEGQ